MSWNEDELAAANAFFGGTPTPAPASLMPQATYQGDAEGWTAYGRGALASAVSCVQNAAEGTRNNTLNKEAYGVARLIAGGHVPAAAAWDALEAAARQAGLGEREIHATLRSATGAGQANPRHVEARPAIAPAYIFRPERYEAEHGKEAAAEQADHLAAWVDEHLPAVDWAAEWDKPTDIEWIVPPLLPARRLVALYSAPKVGKSLLALDLAARIATGTTTWGADIQPRRVLYVDFENDLHTDTISRLKDMGYTPDRLDNLLLLSMPPLPGLDTREGAAQLLAATARYKPELVVIDTLSRAIDGEENSNDTYIQLYRHTLQPLKAQGIAVLRLDHTGKDETKGQRGASAKEGDVDAIWQLATVADGHLRLACKAHRFPLDETDLNLERTDTPLAHEWEDWRQSLDAKEAEFNRILDDAGLPRDVSVRKGLETVRAAGMRLRNQDARDWLKKRKVRTAGIRTPTLGVIEGGAE